MGPCREDREHHSQRDEGNDSDEPVPHDVGARPNLTLALDEAAAGAVQPVIDPIECENRGDPEADNRRGYSERADGFPHSARVDQSGSSTIWVGAQFESPGPESSSSTPTTKYQNAMR